MPELQPPDPLLASLVASADEGAIGLWLIVNVVRNVRAQLSEEPEDQARTAVLALIREALRLRLLIAGTMGDGFDAWHLAPDDAVRRIEREWRELGRDPQPGEIATFATPGRLGYA